MGQTWSGGNGASASAATGHASGSGERREHVRDATTTRSGRSGWPAVAEQAAARVVARWRRPRAAAPSSSAATDDPAEDVENRSDERHRRRRAGYPLAEIQNLSIDSASPPPTTTTTTAKAALGHTASSSSASTVHASGAPGRTDDTRPASAPTARKTLRTIGTSPLPLRGGSGARCSAQRSHASLFGRGRQSPRNEEQYLLEIAMLREKLAHAKLACKQKDRQIKRLEKTFEARRRAIAEDAAAATQCMLQQLQQRHAAEVAEMQRLLATAGRARVENSPGAVSTALSSY